MSKYKRYEKYKDSGVEWIGEIPEHWEVSKLKYVSSITMGQSPKSEECNFDEIGLPFLQGNAEFTSSHPIPKMYCNTANKFSKVNDILLSVRAPVGAMNISDRVYGIGRGLCAITAEKVQVKYLWYSMNVSLEELFIKSKGSTFEAVTVTDVNNLLSIIPPKEEQIAIANFLDQKTAEIDSLIADKEKLIELLQEKRQAIITEAVTKGLNPNVRMKDSGIEWIGEIPEHWEVKRIKYLAIVNPSKSEVRHLPPEQELTFIPMEKIVATGEVDYSMTNTVEKLIDGYTYFRDGDIIMAKVTPCFENGNIAIVNGLLNGIGFGTTELHVLRCNNKCYNKFLFYYLQSDVFKSKGISEMYGVAGLKRIPTDFILNYKLGIPDYQEQKQIALYLDTIVDKINTLISDIQTQIDKLKEYRQSIISEAVTGKIKIYNS